MGDRTIKSIAVFCGSNFGASEDYALGAAALGTAIAEAGLTLVYGGTTKGLMGVVADAALAVGGEVHLVGLAARRKVAQAVELGACVGLVRNVRAAHGTRGIVCWR